MQQFYAHRNVVSAQCQASGISVQVGDRIWGWLPKSWWSTMRRSPHYFGLVIWAPVSGCGQRIAFSLRVGRRGFLYRTRGEAVPGDFRWSETGWRFA